MHTDIPQPIFLITPPPKHYIFYFCMRLKFPLPSEIIHLFCGIFTNESENLQNLRIILYF